MRKPIILIAAVAALSLAAWGGWRVTSDLGRHLARRRRARAATTPV